MYLHLAKSVQMNIMSKYKEKGEIKDNKCVYTLPTYNEDGKEKKVTFTSQNQIIKK